MAERFSSYFLNLIVTIADGFPAEPSHGCYEKYKDSTVYILLCLLVCFLFIYLFILQVFICCCHLQFPGSQEDKGMIVQVFETVKKWDGRVDADGGERREHRRLWDTHWRHWRLCGCVVTVNVLELKKKVVVFRKRAVGSSGRYVFI